MEQTTKSKSSDETDEDKDVFAASGTRPTTRSPNVIRAFGSLANAIITRQASRGPFDRDFRG
jgi:hypothetical protein